MAVRFSENIVVDQAGAHGELYCSEKPIRSLTPIERYVTADSKFHQFASTPFPASKEEDNYNNSSVLSARDNPLLFDSRVIKTMLANEKLTPIQASRLYLSTSNVTENMRKILLRWMFEVVSDQQMEEVIFVQAANYLDRFLSCTQIDKSKLQLLGCASLLLAAKLRHCLIISAETLSDLTDSCFTKEEIVNFETFLLAKLAWDMTPILPNDYLEPFLCQSGLSHLPYIKKHASAFLSMITIYPASLDYPPSVLAAASIFTAVSYNDVPTYDHLTFINKSLQEQLMDYFTACPDLSGLSFAYLVSIKNIIIAAMNQELCQHNFQQAQDQSDMDSDSSSDSLTDSGFSDCSLTDIQSLGSPGGADPGRLSSDEDDGSGANNFNDKLDIQNNSLRELTPNDIMDICISE